MCKLSFVIVLILMSLTGFAQTSPHGGGFKTDCKVCHTSETWKVSKSINSFDHNTTAFKLTGQHKAVECISCHKTLKFEEAKSECISCHSDMHRNTVGPNCTRCHNTDSWTIKSSITLHQSTRFPLEGRHAVAECSSCHVSASNYQYEPLGVECVDCHKKEYLASTNPNHQQLGYPTNCVECHAVNATSWNTTNFNHTSFPLTAGHNITCVECHKGGMYKKIATGCMSCHQVQFNAAKGHVASKFSSDCRTCHNASNWLNPTFNHSTTNFPLTGAHITTDCASCHTTGYAGTSVECKSCHQAKYTASQTPNHTAAGISVDCKTCHSTTAWQPSTFNHSTTIFPLTGAHTAIVQCSSCHLGNTTSAKPDCYSCHQVQYNGAKDHVASKFPTDCKMCHNTANWLQSTFNHATTNFPLTGAHISVECASCHATGYAGTSVECNSCHQAKYTATTTPNHTAAGIPVDCKTCHTTTAWQPSTFNHSTTVFPLTGAHTAIVQCSACHLGNTATTKTDCYSCHQTQYTSAKDHVASKFPTDCTVCHNTANWLQSTFNHATSIFPLTGAHVSVECAACHTSGYAGTSVECSSCHQAKYTATTTPDHTAAGIPVDCKTCHTTAAWQPSTFNHSTTVFPLVGAHTAIVQCSSCHLGNTTSAKPDCISCHQVQYNGAKDHVASKFPTNCTMCHNMNNWLNANFNHSLTNFPLTGAHISVECASCHTAGYAGTSVECKSCHQAKYTATTTPNHTAAGIPVDCKTCHTTAVWQPSTFNHSTTVFPLVGAHTSIVQCSSCHLGNTTSAKTDCYSCHQTQYTSAKDHVASKFPTDCTMCHNMNNWLNANFNHSLTNFPLTGAHTSVECALCHTVSYAGTPTDCNSCHQAKYKATTTPNHTAAAISTDCKTCHTTTAWQPSTFAHLTPLPTQGFHATIVQCSDCHKGNTTSATTDCYSCHSGKFTPTKGHVESGFDHNCTLCHKWPSNDWLNPTFNHATTTFGILIGKHATTTCTQCHTSATSYKGLPTDCYTCHTVAFNGTLNPNHVANKFTTDCTLCHIAPYNDWLNAKFDHTNYGFPLIGVHATTDCAKCHTNGYSGGTPTDCYSCHQGNYANVVVSPTVPSHSINNFSHDCTICHTAAISNWNTVNVVSIHSSHGFTPAGVHATIDCAQCHTNGYSGGTPTDCNSCHNDKYKSSVNPGHLAAGISTDCKTCHSNSLPAWKPSTFTHLTPLPTQGFHATIVQCSDCHKGNTTSATTDCYSCHSGKFTPTKGHVESGFDHNCTLCHKWPSNDWLNPTFNHATTTFGILIGKHATTTCTQCHTSATSYKGLPTDCYTCHTVAFNGTLNPNHVANKFTTDCTLCHIAPYNDWLNAKFDHTNYGFPLIGVHATTDCAKCHTNGYSGGTPTDCYSCHQGNYANVVVSPTVPSHSINNFSHDCTICHTAAISNWNTVNVVSIHSSHGFTPAGVHATIDCAQCHTNGYSGGTPTDCNSCHNDKYKSSVNPGHLAAGISTDCKTCHSNSLPAWKPSTFTHLTPLPTQGFHATIVQCSDCHKGNTTSATTDCYSCHSDKFTATKGHVESGFDHNCTSCHKWPSNDWLNPTFNHATTTFGILIGKHATTTCTQCHTSATSYKGLPTDCYTCHKVDYNGATSPNHVGNKFTTDCTVCHTSAITDWLHANVDLLHSSHGFILVGMHATTDCALCHTTGYAGGTPTDCNSCHTDKYKSSVNPGHIAAGISTDCKTCHSNSLPDWKPSTFAHLTPLPTQGFHATIVQCSDCHKGNTSSATTDCYSCHSGNFIPTKGHVESGFDHNCTLCHKWPSNDWLNPTFNHATTTFGTLSGKHATTTCAQCHTSTSSYKGLPTDCYSCHTVDYNGATSPNHVAAKFPHDCTVCHKAPFNDWLNAKFDHTTTAFPLTGVHLITDCALCHTNGYSGGTPTACNSCHTADYNTATNPNHNTLGLAVTCGDCHTTAAGWAPAKFPNHSTYYALTGFHTSVSCVACHNGVYPNTPKTCYGCHAANYTNTKNPPHLSAASTFTTDCASCHNTTLWAPAPGFNHSVYFVITSSQHRLSCATCHTTPTNYTAFGCGITTSACHSQAHNKTQSCYPCHKK